MEIGAAIPSINQPVGREEVIAIARHADELNFHSVWLGDHIVYPIPPGEDGKPDYAMLKTAKYAGDLYEAMVTAGFVAALTERVKIAFGVLVITYRNPVLTAKMVTTLDHLCSGRTILGVGPGYQTPEFKALGIRHKNTGAFVDDFIKFMRAIEASPVPDFQGEVFSLHDTLFRPQPKQQHLPIWIGGYSEAAMRRAARLGDAWHMPALGFDDVAPLVPRFREIAEEAGRDLTNFTISNRPRLHFAPHPVPYVAAPPGTPFNDLPAHICGPPSYCAEQIWRFEEELGVTHLVLDMHEGEPLPEILKAMDTLAGEVLPQLPKT